MSLLAAQGGFRRPLWGNRRIVWRGGFRRGVLIPSAIKPSRVQLCKLVGHWHHGWLLHALRIPPAAPATWHLPSSPSGTGCRRRLGRAPRPGRSRWLLRVVGLVAPVASRMLPVVPIPAHPAGPHLVPLRRRRRHHAKCGAAVVVGQEPARQTHSFLRHEMRAAHGQARGSARAPKVAVPRRAGRLRARRSLHEGLRCTCSEADSEERPKPRSSRGAPRTHGWGYSERSA